MSNILPEHRVRELLREVARRKSTFVKDKNIAAAEKMLAALNPVQRAFVRDMETEAAALTSRRAGKSSACKFLMLYTALTEPGSKSIYVNTSRGECRSIMWLGVDGFKNIIKEYKLDATTNEQYLEIIFNNGSQIKLMGIDSKSSMDKLRGNSYDNVIIDEAGSIVSLKYFIDDVISSTFADRGGRLRLIGTPTAHCSGYFYDVTKEGSTEEGWSVHKWTHHDNLAMPHLVDYFLKKKKKKGWADDNPTWLRENCGLWIKSDDVFVYNFNKILEENRYYDELPDIVDSAGNKVDSKWEYFMGVDLGYRDSFAYSIWAYNEHHAVAYEVKSFKESELHDGEQGDIIEALCKEYDFTKIVIDGSPAIIEAWKERRGIDAERADKTKKVSYIRMWNSAMLEGKVKFRRNSPLSIEMSNLQWKEETINTPKPKENKCKETPNDVCFVAGTMVTTTRGIVPIEDVVVGDNALTRKGPKPVSATFSLGEKLIYTLTLVDGTELNGTANHPINTDRGVVPLSELTSKDKVYKWQTSTANQKLLNLKESPLDDTQNQSYVTSKVTSFHREDTVCTGQYTQTSMGTSQKDTMFTTKTETPSITKLTTLSVSQQESIYLNMLVNQTGLPHQERVLRKQSQQHQSGTLLQRDVLGTQNTLEISTQKGNGYLLPAQFASISFSPQLVQQRFVETNAMPENAEQAALMTSERTATTAEKSLWETSTQMPEVALVPVAAVLCTGRSEKVYNLTVEEEHEFFANGISVPQCDASLYIWKHLLNWAWIAPNTNYAPGTTDYYIELQRTEKEAAMQKASGSDEYSPEEDFLNLFK